MKEHLTADEYADCAKLREDACAECSEAMSGLNNLVLHEQTTDPEQRRAELTVWLGEQCPECQPLDAAVEIAMQIEHDEALAGFPDFRVDDLPVTDLREELLVYLAETQAEQRNSVTTGEIAYGVPSKVPLEAGKESQFLTDEATLIADQQALDADRATLTADRATEAITDAKEKSKTVELAQLVAREFLLRH